MSDRDFIIQEIRKLFKEQAAQGDLAKVAGTTSPPPKKEPKYTLTRRKKAGGTLKPRENKDADANLTISSDKVKKGLEDAGVTPQEYKEYFEKLSNGAIKPSSDFWLKQKFSFDRYGDINFSKMSDIARALGGKKKPSTSTVSVDPKVQNPNKKIKIETVASMLYAASELSEDYKENYYNKEITPGMDRGETGECKFINQAAINVNPDLKEPSYIYMVLLNSGVIEGSDPIPLKPCDGLDKLIAQFQRKALEGKLKFQDKRSKEDIASLYYRAGKEVEDLGKNVELSKDIQKARQARAGASTQTAADKTPPQRTDEQVNNSEIAVDGKIGSRTAKLFKLFEPEAKPVAPAVAKTTKPATKSSSTSTSRATTGTKQPCVVSINSANDLKVKTVLTILGYGSCDLEAKSKKLRWRERDFTKLLDIFETEKGAAGSSAFDTNYTDKKDRITRFVASPQGQIDIFNKITKSALADKKNIDPVPNRVYGQLGTWMENAVSPMIFDLHTGFMGSPNKLVNFAYVKFGKDTIPLIYLSDHGSLPEIASFMKAINYNRWVMVSPEKRRQSFAAPQNLNGLIRNMTDHSKRIDHFEKEILSAAKNDPKFRDSRYQSLLQDCLNICKGYRDALMNFLQKVKAFQVSPSEQTMKEMVSYGGPISISQQMLHGK